MKKNRVIAILSVLVVVLVFFLLREAGLPIFSAKEPAAETQEVGTVASALLPAQSSLSALGGYLPRLGGLFLILIAGALVAVGGALLIERLLTFVRLEKAVKKIKIPKILERGGIKLSLSELIREIAFFLIIILTLITALEFYGLKTDLITGRLLAYIPHVIAAVFILIVGIFLAILISRIITLVGGNVRIAQSDTLGSVAKYSIIIVAGLIALEELGLGALLSDVSKDILFSGLILALALGFGLGAKEKAGKFLGSVFNNKK